MLVVPSRTKNHSLSFWTSVSLSSAFHLVVGPSLGFSCCAHAIMAEGDFLLHAETTRSIARSRFMGRILRSNRNPRARGPFPPDLCNERSAYVQTTVNRL